MNWRGWGISLGDLRSVSLDAPYHREKEYIWLIQYSKSLSMFAQTFSFLAFIVPEKSDTKIFKNGKI